MVKGHDPTTFKDYDRTHWKNVPKREVKIFRSLEDESKTFSDLLKWLGWGSQTLTVYLKNLEKKGCIEKKKRGRYAFYTLIRSNSYVRQMLGWDRQPSSDVRIHKRVELDRLDEEKFIQIWFNSVKFSFLNIIQDFMFLGEKTRESGENTDPIKTMRRFLEAHIQDLEDTITFQGEVMAKRVRRGTLKPERIWEVRNKLMKQIDNKFMSIVERKKVV
jgi:predicted transcriptional regulator